MNIKVRKWFIDFLLLTAIVFVLFEVVLRIWGKYETYNERASNKYQSLFKQKMGSWYFLEKPYSSFPDQRSEFQYTHSVDSLGCSWYNRPKSEDTSNFKILVIGDSFTFGIGAPKDSCWPILLAQIFERDCKKNVEIINGSRQGSDPFFSYMVYRDVLKNLHPDLVMVSLNSTDIIETYSRGGWERFKSDSTTVTTDPPWFEPLYHYSHSFRALLSVCYGVNNEYLYSEYNYGEVATNACKKLLNCLDSLSHETTKNDAQLLVFNFPLPREIDYAQRNQFYSFGQMIVKRPYVNSDLDSALRGYFTEHNIKQYYWPIDGHFNSKGYSVMAEKMHTLLMSNNEKITNYCAR